MIWTFTVNVLIFLEDRDHITEGKSFCRNADDKLGIKLNDDQRKAIQKAVTSSFSLIQGPPGLLTNTI